MSQWTRAPSACRTGRPTFCTRERAGGASAARHYASVARKWFAASACAVAVLATTAVAAWLAASSGPERAPKHVSTKATPAALIPASVVEDIRQHVQAVAGFMPDEATVYLTTRSAAARAFPGGGSSYGDDLEDPVYFVVVRFPTSIECRLCERPAGAPSIRGSIMTNMIDRATGFGFAGSFGDASPNVSALGEPVVVRLHE